MQSIIFSFYELQDFLLTSMTCAKKFHWYRFSKIIYIRTANNIAAQPSSNGEFQSILYISRAAAIICGAQAECLALYIHIPSIVETITQIVVENHKTKSYQSNTMAYKIFIAHHKNCTILICQYHMLLFPARFMDMLIEQTKVNDFIVEIASHAISVRSLFV